MKPIRKEFCRTLVVFFLLLGCQEVRAESPNPTLFSLDRGIDNDERRSFLTLSELNIQIRLEGKIVEAVLTAHFLGAGTDSGEGHFQLQLPRSAVVTGYALDVEDAMIDGVLIEKARGIARYEEKVRAKIDPGLAEISAGNMFATKIYPVDSERGRTIRVTFVTPYDSDGVFQLPLSDAQAVDSLTVQVRSAARPAVTLPSGLRGIWKQSAGDLFALDAEASNVALAGSLQIEEHEVLPLVKLAQHFNGEKFFEIADEMAVPDHALPAPKKIRIYWDTSLSRRDDMLAEEVTLLEKYAAPANAQVQLVRFSSVGADVTTLQSPDRLRQSLEATRFLGATSFASVGDLKLEPVDVCLLFSDGLVTIDKTAVFDPACVLHVVTSSGDANVGLLSSWARATGGSFSDLRSEDVSTVLYRLQYGSAAVVSIEDQSGRHLPFAAMPSRRNQWLVLGEVPIFGDVVLTVRAPDGSHIKRRYTMPTKYTNFDGVAALAVAQRVSVMEMNPELSEELLELSRKYSLSSSRVSFVVFESAEDYVGASVEPPRTYPAAQLAEYNEAKRKNDEENAEIAEDRMDALAADWEKQKEWWQTKFNPHARKAAPRERSNEELEDIVVTGLRGSIFYSKTIALEPWSSERPYVQALEHTSQSDFWDIVAGQQATYGDAPSFYLDIAEWLNQHRRRDEAVQFALSALELSATSEETISIVADRLLRYAATERAMELYEQLVHMLPHVPQPRYRYALMLAKRAGKRTDESARADLEHAIDLLNQIICGLHDPEYDGIDLIALMDANALVEKLRRMGIEDTQLDPRLRALLDVDLRIVVQWNTAATDIDLWVDEPNGERAIYYNQRTRIGGHMSDDMTGGYGPEEYLLRRARAGKYKIRVNVFAADPIAPNGPTTVTARIIHDFGRRNEREEMIDLELTPDEDGEVLVGEVAVR